MTLCFAVAMASTGFAVAQTPSSGGSIEADAVQFDEAEGTLDAEGNVAIERDGQTLRADTVLWKRQDNTMDASGQVILTEPDGTRTDAQRMVLDNQLSAGEMYEMRQTLPNQAWIKADTASVSDTNIKANDIAYSACPECEDPEASPFWQLKARTIDYDRVAQDVRYRDVRLEVAGVPVLYSPYFVHPGPDVVRRSGFLNPSFDSSEAFGAGIETPYHFALASNYDLTVRPRFSEKQDPYLVSNWRHLTRWGEYEVNTYMHDSDDALLTSNPDESFNFGVKASGSFVFNDWHTKFKLVDANDDLFFRRYKVDSLDKMESNATSVNYLDNGYVQVAAYKYRSALRDETDKTVDVILPSITHRLDFDTPLAKGQLSMLNSLQHNSRGLGLDITEASSRLTWDRQIISKSGLVWDARNALQLDAYHYSQKTGDPITKEGAPKTLAANSASLQLSYPLEKLSRTNSQTITPEMQIVLATDNERYEDIPYTSSATLDLSQGSLFQFAAPQDESSRINVGISHEMNHVNTLDTRFFAGQSYNLSSQDHALKTGYGDGSSALITRAEIGYGPANSRFQFSQDLRTDPSNLETLRNRTTAQYRRDGFSIGTSYSFYEAGQNGDDPKKEQTVQMDWQMSENWNFETSHRRDLELDRNVLSSAQLVYEDICTILTFAVTRDYASIDNLEPETSLSFTFVLKTLGGTQ